MYSIPKIPIGKTIEVMIDFFVSHFSIVTKVISHLAGAGIDLMITAMLFPPPWLFILILTGITYAIARKKGLALFCFIGFSLILNLGLWNATINTLALVFISTLTTIAIGLPLGIFAALNNTANRIIMPVLDFMQTMPAFVYLIPAIPFFGLGKVAAIFSTLIFAMPPSIRLTALGIRQVPVELVEAADAFGSNKWQKLFKLQIPMASPTIMAGVNQTIMLALSMVVIAAMIGAKGLGGEVWKAIQRLQPGRGFEAGLSIVILAIVLDRIMQSLGKTKQ
ncbi:MAG: proline/glycine betaine ABC transporter permease [Proteobacteria bacterium]|nr:proline/glycine betaine ABC transporter permease [Pseudomonadota bacterium]